MRRYLFASVAAVASATAFAGSASADLVSEVRLGIMQENICVLDCDNANKEPGQSLNGDVLFHSPDFLGFIWSPKPYVMGSVNFQGETSFGGVGSALVFPGREKLAIRAELWLCDP
jgi:lipid A 3-O-deacylase